MTPLRNLYCMLVRSNDSYNYYFLELVTYLNDGCLFELVLQYDRNSKILKISLVGHSWSKIKVSIKIEKKTNKRALNGHETEI